MKILVVLLVLVYGLITWFIIIVGNKDQKAEDKMHYPECEDWYLDVHEDSLGPSAK